MSVSTHNRWPTSTDDRDAGYYVGDTWIDSTVGRTYVCTSNTVGAAVWQVPLPPQPPPPIVGDKNYVHTQSQAASVWNVQHNLGKYPCGTVVDSGGAEVEGEIQYLDANRAILTFSAAFSGQAFFN